MTEGQLVLLLAALLGISEFLASFPKVKSNSIFQLAINIIKLLVGKKN